LPGWTFLPQGRDGMKMSNLLHSKSSFVVLQALDLVTTLVAFHFGAFEVNPLVGRFTSAFGPTGGVLVSKLIAILIVFRVRKLMWIANIFYLGIVCWNTAILLALSHR